MKGLSSDKNIARQVQLIAEKEKYALILRSIGDGVITVDTQKRIVMMNNGAETITGWSSEHAIGKPLSEVFKIVDKNTGEPLDYLLDFTLSSGEKTGLKRDTVLISGNGSEKYVSACISPIKVLEDTIGMVIVFRDITRIRKAEEKLLLRQRNLEMIFNAAPVGMMLVDKNTFIRKVNKSMLQIMGKQEHEMVNQKIGSCLGCTNSYKDENGCGFSDECRTCKLRDALFKNINSIETMQEIEVPYTLLADGTEKKIWLKINSVPLVIGGRKYILLVVDDITNIKTAEEVLRRYQLLSQHANDIIIFSQNDGRIIEANNAALMAYGYTREEILNKSIFDLVKPDDSSLVRAMSQEKNTEGVYYEATARRKDGSIFNVEVSLQSAEIGNGKVLLSIQRDISERKQVQKELERARECAEAANRAKSEFLAKMSHEIRTPLNGMLGMIDLTLLTDLTDEQKENLSIAKSCASTLLSLINDILDFSRTEAKKLTLENIGFDFMELIEQTIKPHDVKAQEKGLRLTYQVDPKIPRIVNGDPNRLRQVINNLLGNALKFTDKGGIKLSACLKDNTDEYIELEFQISDTGVGIDSKDIEKIFEIFTQAENSITRKNSGSGLGLAISKQLVEMMGGNIWVESKKGEGSTFYFTVKLNAGGTVPSTKNNVEAIARTKNPLRILLAEDDIINQVAIARILKEAGHFVETVSNGVEALQAISEKSIDLVLMDIQMPEMDGIEVVRKIRNSEKGMDRHIPIIALTAYALQGDREKYLSAGMDDYIAKPVKINSLLEKIEKAAEESKEKKQKKRLRENVYGHDYDDLKNEDLLIEHNNKVRKIVNSMSMNSELLKDAFDKKDLALVEKYVHEIKELSSQIGATSIKKAAFKAELAARRGSIDAVAEHFDQVIAELDKYKKQLEENEI